MEANAGKVFLSKDKDNTRGGLTNNELQDQKRGPPGNCAIGVGTGQTDVSNVGFAREQWDHAAWKRRVLPHCAKIVGGQTQNKHRHEEMKSFSQKIPR